MHINRLPCLVFRLIFSKLSFPDVLQAGRVCPLWRVYQLQITNKVTCVTLLIGIESNDNQSFSPLGLIKHSPFYIPHRDELQSEDGSPLFAPQLGPDWSQLCITNFDLSTVYSLTEALSNVTTLNVSIFGIDNSFIDHVIELLNNWKHQLSTFKFWCNITESIWQQVFGNLIVSTHLKSADQILKLLRSLNSLTKLNHLTLDIDNYDQTAQFNRLLFGYPAWKYESAFINQFVFLSRLREFYFKFRHSNVTSAFYRWLKQNGDSNTQLEHVGFVGLNAFDFNEIKNLKFAKKVTFLSACLYSYRLEALLANLNPFTSLTTLTVRLEQPFPEIINKLTIFKQLVYLQLESGILGRARMSDWDHIAQRSIAQLLSVKILSLRLNIVSHSDLESSHWAWIFPNVQVLSVHHECFHLSLRGFETTCRHSFMKQHGRISHGSIVSQEHVNECIRELLSTFKQCPKLRRIYLNESSNLNSNGFTQHKFKFML